jgi:hypothetical protein
MDEAHRALVEAVGKLASSDDWLAVLNLSRRLRSHSPLNCLLLVSQGATGLVMGYRSWQQIPAQGGGHCQVRRGAKSLKIFAPVTKTVLQRDDTGEERRDRRLVGFRLVSVFDQSALVSPPALPDPAAVTPALLDGDLPAQVWETLASQAKAAGYRLIDDPGIATSIAPRNGLTDALARTVAVRPDLPAAQRAKTLAHELAHALLHDPERRPAGLTEEIAEVEAESVAYLVMGELGLDAAAYTIPYVTGWSKGDPDLVVATARRVIGTAREILDGGLHLSPGAPAADLDLDSRHAEWARDLSSVVITQPDGGDPSPAVRISTAAGHWEISWDSQLSTYAAHHVRGRAADGDDVSTALGTAPGAITTIGQLEEQLSFALPDHARRILLAERSVATSADPPARRFRFPDDVEQGGYRNVPPVEVPAFASVVNPRGEAPVAYGPSLDEHEHLRVWERDGYRLEILDAVISDDSYATAGEAATRAVAYRLWYRERVVFSGDDINAPGHADAADDRAVYEVTRLLCEPGDPDGARSTAQAAFVAEHGPTLLELVTPPSAPFPPGTRVAARPPGRRDDVQTGKVVEAIGEEGQPTTSYAWRPDRAELVGHPWRDNPRHVLVTPAEWVLPTLAPPDAGLGDDASRLPLAFGATVTFAADDGQVLAGEVVRAVRTPTGPVYDVLPEAIGADLVRLPAADVAPRVGTAWPDIDRLIAARLASGFPLEPGELLAVGDDVRMVVETADGLAPLPVESAEDFAASPLAQRTAAVAALDASQHPPDPPPTVTLRRVGNLAQVGDPRHGWITIPTDLLASALTIPPGQLSDFLAGADVDLAGDEVPLTLAALVAKHRADLLGRSALAVQQAPFASPHVEAGL